MLCLLPRLAAPFEISSYAFVNDDGTIRIRNRTYRLFGIYVPRTTYTCQRFTQPMNCASQTRLALEFKIGSKFVHCVGDGRNGDGTYPAFCDVEGYDLGTYLIEQGFGVALPDAPFEYLMIERIARSRGVGVWAVPGQDLYRFPP
ncbi:MAG: nuclease-like protein [Gammaproteobacteria bacterium]|nr:nuclease-like protein [Gammaproteobacteria bacterium]